MAKKQSGPNFSFSQLGNLVKDIAKSVPIVIADENEKNNMELIGTGIYILNAALSGSLFGGIQSDRITVLAGDSGCLFPNEKVNIYNMRTKNKKHDVYEQRADKSFQKR